MTQTVEGRIPDRACLTGILFVWQSLRKNWMTRCAREPFRFAGRELRR